MWRTRGNDHAADDKRGDALELSEALPRAAKVLAGVLDAHFVTV